MSANVLTIKDIRSFLVKELKSLYEEQEADSLARIIIKTISKGEGLHHTFLPEQVMEPTLVNKVITVCNELLTGKPIQYVLGETEFYNCIISVSPAVLIPRSETEELIELVIRENRDYQGHLIDFGTGSGCIAIALAANMQGVKVTATDISTAALGIASKNAIRNNVTLNLVKDDILNPTVMMKAEAGIIVSNPPYVRNSEKKLMHRNVLDFEPHTALFVEDDDPLIFYEALFRIAESILTEYGKYYFEINEALGEEMKKLSVRNGFSGEIIKDLNGRDRFIKGFRGGR